MTWYLLRGPVLIIGVLCLLAWLCMGLEDRGAR